MRSCVTGKRGGFDMREGVEPKQGGKAAVDVG